jgi:hypothetical protein
VTGPGRWAGFLKFAVPKAAVALSTGKSLPLAQEARIAGKIKAGEIHADACQGAVAIAWQDLQ